ncbi:MAG: Ppx/GppA family phosphatase [Alphaproteobacteria bacterium]|nr:Ppx/GppA family phosphatase [Alphaproteobacteria bacterium]
MEIIGRIAVIDLGSNSLRLVVFERLGGALFPLLNEKVMCGLGRGIASTGRLNAEGVTLALANLRRFVALARALGAEHLAVLATAAVRDASDGLSFAAEVEQQCRVPVKIIDGAEEARLSAAGVLAGIPEADGLVGDLGGGSVELVRIRAAVAGEIVQIGPGITLPLGPLRLAALGGSVKAISEAAERAFVVAPVLRTTPGKNLYLVGGAARAIARLHMEHTHYPLHIVHQYTIGRRDAEAFFDIIGRQSHKSLERITSIARKRLELVPAASLVLRKLIAVAGPQSVIFSAFGLREGYAYGLISAWERGPDPLIAACAAIARSQSRFHLEGDQLQRWTAPLFPSLSEGSRRLHRAACWLSDIAWSEHPDYRAELAFTRSLRMPFAAIGHADRVFVATVLHTRYGGAADDPVKDPTRLMLDEQAAGEVRTLGLALRLAYTLCGGTIDLLSELWLGREGDSLVLEIPCSGSLFVGEAVQRRLDVLARSLGTTPVVRRREARQLARG